MIKTSEIEKVCQEISEISVDYERIIHRYLSVFPNKRKTFLQELLKDLSEIHLDLCLEAIAQKTGITIDQKPLPRPETAKCTYGYNPLGRLYVRFKFPREGQDFEYDTVAMVNGTPVDFEISIIGVRGGWRKRVDTRGRLIKDFYQKKLQPLKELFDSDVAYVFIVPGDSYELLDHPSRDDAMAFKENNGLLVPLPFTKQHLKLGVRRIAREKNITYLDNTHEKGIPVR